MMLHAYAVLDTKTGAYSQPMFFATDGAAVRAIITVGTDRDTQIGRYPEDFVFYHIGAYDDSTGMLHPLEIRSFGSVASLLVRPSQSEA